MELYKTIDKDQVYFNSYNHCPPPPKKKPSNYAIYWKNAESKTTQKFTTYFLQYTWKWK